MTIIYALVDPRTGDPRYVGQTLDGRTRLRNHITEADRKDNPKARWIKELRAAGLEPALIVLERITRGSSHVAEAAWIKAFSESYELFNLDWNPRIPLGRWSPGNRGKFQRFGKPAGLGVDA